MIKPVFIVLIFISRLAAAQLIATVELKEPVEGICDAKNIYAMIPSSKGQKEAEPSVAKEEIPAKLQNEIRFLKDHPDYKGKITVNCLINCKGELVKCRGSVNSTSEVLEKEIIDYFKKLGEWEPARLYANKVDSELMFSFKIRKGIISY